MSTNDPRASGSSGGQVHELRRRPVKHVLVTLAVVFVMVALGTAGVLFSGLFNVAATVADSPPLRWMFVTVREESIKFHARDIKAPPVADAEHLANGFQVYRENCVMCHTPVGRKPTSMSAGFNPQAPSFEENDMTVAELFWVTKNGIRFTGMPAWGPSRSDQDLWDAVGFVMTLPKMSAADYDALDRRTPLKQPTMAQGADPGNAPAQASAASSPAQSTRTTSQ
jgi:mono/diheme cytochrome c family protein